MCVCVCWLFDCYAGVLLHLKSKDQSAKVWTVCASPFITPYELAHGYYAHGHCDAGVKFSWIPPDAPDPVPPSWDLPPLFGDPAPKLGDPLEFCSAVSVLFITHHDSFKYVFKTFLLQHMAVLSFWQWLKWSCEAGGGAHLTKPGWSKPHTHSTPN